MPAATNKPKITPASASLLRTFRSAASQRFLDDDRVVMSILGKQAKENGGERCSIVSLADEKETVIDPSLYAQGNPGMLALDPKRGPVRPSRARRWRAISSTFAASTTAGW